MLSAVSKDMMGYPRAHSYWLRVHFQHIQTQHEIVIGPQAMEWVKVLQRNYNDCIVAASKSNISSLFSHGISPINTDIPCENGQCHQPFTSLKEALSALDI